MYLSRLLSRPIRNKTGETVGKVADIVVANLNSPLPAVSGIIASRGTGKTDFFIPITDCAEFEEKQIDLKTDVVNFSPFERRGDEVLLARYILDKQIVDVKERKLTRINDLELSLSNGNLFLTGVDVSFRGILNRLSIPSWGFIFKYNIIPWQNIQFFGVDLPVKINIDYDRLESLHPADIARFIFHGPEVKKGSQIIQSLEEEIAADVVESLPLEFQVNIIENMSPANAAKILSEMESHHAADLLAELDLEKSEELLQKMHEEKVSVVRQLLSYPPSTVGALMKVEFIAIHQLTTVEELYTLLQTSPKLPEFLLYFYITESQTSKKLIGVVSLWELFKASPRERMENIMLKDLVKATPLESARGALKKMTQYDLSAIPVINRHHHIVGIVTLTHAIKLLIPKSWQTRVNLAE